MRGLCGLCRRIDFRAERPPSLGSLWRWGYSGLVASYENVPRRAVLPLSLQKAAQRGSSDGQLQDPLCSGTLGQSPLAAPAQRSL